MPRKHTTSPTDSATTPACAGSSRKDAHSMTLYRLFLAETARDIVNRLNFCEDQDFAGFIAECILSRDLELLEPANIMKTFPERSEES